MASGGPPDKLSTRHRLIAYGVIAGKSNVEIAAELGINSSRISVIRSSPLFQALVEQLHQEIRARTMGGVVDKILHEGGKSVDVLVELRDHAENENVRLGAAKDLLDRNPLTARVQRTEEERTVKISLGSDVLRRLAVAVAEDEGRDFAAIEATATVVDDGPARVRTLDEVLAEMEERETDARTEG